MKQKTVRRVAAGDVFCIPAWNKLGASGFLLGRYIGMVGANAGYLVEVFRHFHESLPAMPVELALQDRLFQPIMCDFHFPKGIPAWKVIASDPHYTTDTSEYSAIAIAFDTALWIGGSTVPIRKSTSTPKTEDSTCWRMHHLVIRVSAYLAGVFAQGEVFDYSRMPQEWRYGAPGMTERAYAVMREVDHRIFGTKSA